MITNCSLLWKIQLNFVLFRKCFNYTKKSNFLIPVFGKTFSGKTNKAATKNLTVNHSFVCPTLFEKKPVQLSQEYTLNSLKFVKHHSTRVQEETVSRLLKTFFSILRSAIIHKGPHTDRRVTIPRVTIKTQAN